MRVQVCEVWRSSTRSSGRAPSSQKYTVFCWSSLPYVYERSPQSLHPETDEESLSTVLALHSSRSRRAFSRPFDPDVPRSTSQDSWVCWIAERERRIVLVDREKSLRVLGQGTGEGVGQGTSQFWVLSMTMS